MFRSIEEQYSRTRRTTISFICVTGGRSKETPRYFAGSTESIPRRRAFATIWERHSQGRATSSGPRIQPEPSQMPNRQGRRSPDRAEAATSELLRVRDVLERRALAGPLLDGLLLPRPVRELRVVLEEDEADGSDRPVSVLGEDQLRPAGVLGLGVVVIVAIEEADDVGVLLQGAAFSQVREDRALVGPLLGCAGEL